MLRYKPSTWNLKELASGPRDPTLLKQINDLEELTSTFERNKNNLNSKLTSRRFLDIISEIEEIYSKLNIIAGYAALLYSANTQSDEATSLLTRISRLGSDISNRILFFDLWWKKLDEKNAQRLLKNTRNLTDYLTHKRISAKYTLSEPEEKIINTFNVTGVVALVKLYDKITNAFQYKIKFDGKTISLTREELTNYIRSIDPKVRKIAYQKLLTKYAQNRGVLGEIYQNLVLNWVDEGVRIRGYDSPISIRNVGNNIDDKTIESLLAVCKKNSPVFQKFFIQKSKMLNLKKLRRYDLYAPISFDIKEKNYSYGKSVKLVLESLGRFSPEFESMAKNVFNENHIDSEIRQGKRDGAFCSTLGPKITPFVMLNFTGKTRDVFTLAHELGHAIHSQMANNKSILIQDASLPLAETASTFSELLLYDNISKVVTSREKKMVLAEKIDDLYATIMRQSFFTMFEISAHQQITDGGTVDEISTTYLKNLKEQFGGSVNISEDFAVEWSYIPHFFHTPFYCYAYAFGNLLALSLFQRYKKEGKDFVPVYTNILAAGGSKKAENLLAEYGLDISSTKFWQEGFEYVNNQVESLIDMN